MSYRCERVAKEGEEFFKLELYRDDEKLATFVLCRDKQSGKLVPSLTSLFLESGATYEEVFEGLTSATGIEDADRKVILASKEKLLGLELGLGSDFFFHEQDESEEDGD